MDLWEPERACWAEGAALVCGVDEAGAGPLAGWRDSTTPSR